MLNFAVLSFVGVAGDRNDRAMRGSQFLGAALGRELNASQQVIGTPGEITAGGWELQLRRARTGLAELGVEVAKQLERGKALLTLNRCAAALATLPKVAERRPDAVVVWFDAHGDCNVPETAPAHTDAYLGGMVISGAAGLWDTGLGAGLPLSQVLLVGSRDLDPPELERVRTGELSLVPIGPSMLDDLRRWIAGRPVYIHLDCDVMDAGLLPTEFQVPAGLNFKQLREISEVLAEHEILGLEIAEFEREWPDGSTDEGRALIEALQPLLRLFER